jgi:hypothetical protein
MPAPVARILRMVRNVALRIRRGRVPPPHVGGVRATAAPDLRMGGPAVSGEPFPTVRDWQEEVAYQRKRRFAAEAEVARLTTATDWRATVSDGLDSDVAWAIVQVEAAKRSEAERVARVAQAQAAARATWEKARAKEQEERTAAAWDAVSLFLLGCVFGAFSFAFVLWAYRTWP